MIWLRLARTCSRVQFLAADAHEWCYARYLAWKRKQPA
jgi:hypothetical protein